MPSTVPHFGYMAPVYMIKGFPERREERPESRENTQRSPDRKTTTWASYMYLRAS